MEIHSASPASSSSSDLQTVDLPGKLRDLTSYRPGHDYWLSTMANFLLSILPREQPIEVTQQSLGEVLQNLSNLGERLHRECSKGWIRALFTRGVPEDQIQKELIQIAERLSGKRIPNLDDVHLFR